MKALGLSARIRRKRKYYSYQGEVGKKAENLIQRQLKHQNQWESATQMRQSLPFQQAIKNSIYRQF